MEVLSGRPNCEGKSLTEIEIYNVLEKLGIEFKSTEHQPAATMEICQGISKVLKANICKNLFLCNRQKTQFYLLLMPANKPFKTKELSSQLSIARLSFAEEEFLKSYMNTFAGSASVLGLLYDKDKKVKLLVDEDILKEEKLGCHPCVNTTSLSLCTKDVFEVFLPFTGHNYNVVKLLGE